MANLNFNATNVDPQQTFEPIPDGWYNVIIEESEMKPTKDQQGRYLQLKLKVLDGQHANRVLFDRLNLENRNQTAVDIAYSTLSAICHATGVIQVADSNQLHNIPMQAKVKYRPADANYDAGNEIKGYKACDGLQAPAAGGAQQGFNAPAQNNAAPAPQQAPQAAPPQQAAPAAAPQQQQWTPPAQEQAAPVAQQQAAPQTTQPPQQVAPQAAAPAPETTPPPAQEATQAASAVPPWKQ